MSGKVYSINMRNFNSTSVTKIGENFRANKEEAKKDSNGKISLQLNKQNNKKNEALENLEKLKKNFLDAKKSLAEKEMDPKEKKYKIEELDENIKMVEAQI